MKSLFDKTAEKYAVTVTKTYSTSFSLGILLINKNLRQHIYNIYGFVRCADEIVDSFHGYPQERLLKQFRIDTYQAIADGISLNPVLNVFVQTVNKYNIPDDLIELFLESMAMDLNPREYDRENYNKYILGSAEVVGLMCLCVFTEGNKEDYERLKPAAMKLGAAFQKINFLRDVQADFETLGRSYFPDVNLAEFKAGAKREIEAEIKVDFDAALVGVRELPRSSRLGVFLAYVYYKALFRKIQGVPADRIMRERIRISNPFKIQLMFYTVLRHNFNMV